MAEDIKKERRRYPRHYAVVADYKLADSDSVKVGQVKNISAVGICLILYDNVKIGTGLELEIYLPSTVSSILAKGRVVWVKEYKIISELKPRFDAGIEFLEIQEADRHKISQYVSSVIPKDIP